jgi:hypothetical protein
MDMPIGVNVWVPNTDLDSCLETAFKMWLHENAHEVIPFRNHMRDKRDSLVNKNGMSKQKTWKEYLEIPQSLAFKIQQMTHKDWPNDKKITERIVKLMPKYLCYEKNCIPLLGGSV